MGTRKFSSLVLAVVLFVSGSVFAVIDDHFDNDVLDSAWQVNYTNTTSWNYTESGSLLTCGGIGRIDNNSDSDVLLTRSFLASGDFEVKSRMLWDNHGQDSARSWLEVVVFSGSTRVAWGGYCDYWIFHSGQKVARFNYSEYIHYESGTDTLPYSGSGEFSIIRTNGSIDIMWNSQVIFSGYSNLAIDKIGLGFHNLEYYPGESFATISLDYVTAIPEPATMILLCAGVVLFKRK